MTKKNLRPQQVAPVQRETTATSSSQWNKGITGAEFLEQRVEGTCRNNPHMAEWQKPGCEATVRSSIPVGTQIIIPPYVVTPFAGDDAE